MQTMKIVLKLLRTAGPPKRLAESTLGLILFLSLILVLIGAYVFFTAEIDKDPTFALIGLTGVIVSTELHAILFGGPRK